MKTFRVSGISGLYHEFFNPDPDQLKDTVTVKNSRLDGSGAFWNAFFKRERIERAINTLRDNIHTNLWSLPQYRSILANPEKFIELALKAPQEVCSPSCTPRRFFSCLETMTILCRLYSDFELAPFRLTLQDGFQLNDCSSKVLYQQSLHPQENPYLLFVDQYVMPVIEDISPDVLFLEGKLNHYLAAAAMRTRLRLPGIHICLTRHASEYYSLNKIEDYLKQNQPLFQIVDSVALEYFEDTEKAVINALSTGGGLQSVPNLIYKDLDGDIHKTEFAVPVDCKRPEVYARGTDPTADIHLEPFSKCHWNRCAFCGINKKYHHEHSLGTEKALHEKTTLLKQLSETYQYLWFIDEALRPEQLRALADEFLSKEIRVYWQARCRADKSLLENGLPKLLYEAGLRELRIGLESASYFVLKLMNKFEDGFRLNLMEAIIRDYTALGVSIHCPMILGFPQEGQGDRQKTYEFLSEMREKYPLFTFNLNILYLDVSSPLYHHWAEYQIQEVRFPCEPQFFLGNQVEWMPTQLQKELDAERQTFMREHLYPWLPANALTAPTILYRLSETARRTLSWKTAGEWDETPIFSFDMVLCTAPSVTVSRETEDLYLVYCWDTHHYMQGNRFLLDLLYEFQEPRNPISVIKSLVSQNPAVFRYEELPALIHKMFQHGYLTGTYQAPVGIGNQRVREEYDQIYETETYLYELKPERMLVENQHLLSAGEALELGIGMGRNIPFLLERGFHVEGIDLSEAAVRKLRARYGTQGVFEAQDIRSFPIRPFYYTLIVCSMVLSYLDDAELAALAERIKRGLKPGGYLFIKDLSSDDVLSKLPESQTAERRNFFTREKALRLFKGLTPVEVSLVFRKEPQRFSCGGYYDLLFYFGQKPD